MAVKLTRATAVKAINKKGALLVYPINNKKEPASLWSELWPRTKMRWEWDEEGDSRVADMWHMREQLSRSRQVIYTKWYQGRATLFSFDVFVNLLSFLNGSRADHASQMIVGLSSNPASQRALEFLEADSPLSTKQLKAALELEGRLFESAYNRALKPLWSNLLIVAFGEFDDSSFPSLAIGATKTLFEELWLKSAEIDPTEAERFLRKRLGEKNPFFKYAQKIKKSS